MDDDWLFDATDRTYMAMALGQARLASARGETPVGAVIVRSGAVLASAHNRRRETHDPAGHAEILALRAAGAVIGDWRFVGCTLYVTLEPCPMCVSACRQARLDLVIWGAPDPVMGACGSVADLAEDPRLGPPLAHRGGLRAETSATLLRDFFAKLRGSS